MRVLKTWPFWVLFKNLFLRIFLPACLFFSIVFFFFFGTSHVCHLPPPFPASAKSILIPCPDFSPITCSVILELEGEVRMLKHMNIRLHNQVTHFNMGSVSCVVFAHGQRFLFSAHPLILRSHLCSAAMLTIHLMKRSCDIPELA